MTIPLIQDAPKRTVYFPADPTVDLAAIPLTLDPTRFAFDAIPNELVFGDKDFADRRIREGVDIFFVAHYLYSPGDTSNVPLVRFGKIAQRPDSVALGGGPKRRVFMIDVPAIEGMSGAPVYAYFDHVRSEGTVASYLIGVIMFQAEGGRLRGSGLSYAIPGQQILDLLHGNDLQRQRMQRATCAPAPYTPRQLRPPGASDAKPD